MNAKEAEELYKRSIGEVVELYKPRFEKRFVYFPQHPHGAEAFVRFAESQLIGVSMAYVLAFGFREMRGLRSRVAGAPLSNYIDVHYTLPTDFARMAVELVIYFDGEKHAYLTHS